MILSRDDMTRLGPACKGLMETERMNERRRLRYLFTCICLVAIAALGRAEPPEPPPSITASETTGSVLIDGKLDEDAWTQGRWHTGFRLLDAPGRSAVLQTSFSVCHDQQYAYIGIRLDEPTPQEIQAVQAERDGNVYSRDCVEVMLDPNPDADVYYHIVVNSLGALYDSQVRSAGGLSDRTWNGRLTWATHVGTQAWSVELAIPFAQFELGAESPGRWRCNVTRSRRTAETRVLSSFVPLTGSFHQPELFAALHFGDIDLSHHLWQIDPPFDVRVTATQTGLQLACSMMVENGTDTFRFLSLDVGHGSASPGTETVHIKGGLDVGQTLKFDIPAVRAKSGNGLLTVVLRDRLAPRRPLAIRSFPLKVQYTPLAIDVVKPFYRDSIYATEDLREIVANIRIDLPAEKITTCELRTDLIPQGATKPIVSGKCAAAESRQISLPIPDLAVGSYVLTAELVQIGNETDNAIASATRTIRKLPPAAHEWRIREDCVALYNGEPFVPFGFFSVPSNQFQEVAAAGHNALQWYCAQYKRTPETLFEALAPVSDAGLKMMFYPSPNDRYWLARYKRIHEPMTAKEADALADRVTSIKGHPAILGYYLFDEPSCHTVLPARARQCYEICRTADPFHPCIVLCQNPGAMFTFRDACDIHMPDPYPGFVYRGLAARDMRVVKTYIETAVKASRGRQAVWFTPQAFHWHRPNQRAPNFRELRNMVWQGIIYGATGVVAYKAERWDPDIRLGMDFLAGEVRDLRDAVIAGDRQPGVNVVAGVPEHIHCSVRQTGQELVVLACSTSATPQTATLTLAGTTPPNRLYAVSEGRTLELKDGAFTDSFSTYGVHLYTTIPQLSKRETVTDTQRQIDHLRAPKPGNVVHESTGTVVTTSNDARMATGVIDSQTVFVSNKVGWLVKRDSPGAAHLILRLPRPDIIGRLVLYAHGVRECRADVREGDDWHRVADAQPLDDVPCTVQFAQVTASRIRVTVTKFDGDSCQLYEIEGYAQ